MNCLFENFKFEACEVRKCEFATCTERSRSIANEHFYNERNEEIGILKQIIIILFPKQ